MTTRNLGAYAACLCALLACERNADAQTRPSLPIAYISVQKILAEADDAKAASKELETLRADRNRELTAKRQALDSTKLQLANAGGIFSGARRQQLTEQVKREEQELQQATLHAQTDFTDRQRKLQDRLRTELGTIVNAMAAQRGVQYVLNQDVAVVLAPAGANWTDEVLQRLNAASRQRAASASPPEKSASPAAPKTP